MCGLVGVCFSNQREQLLSLPKMRDQLRHRGPDDEGIWFDFDAGIGLGHRRLAILDLSHFGHQPMISRSGRFVMVFNGEIYNHRDIRKEIEQKDKVIFCGHSDSEVFLVAIDIWGVEKTLSISVGMFAIAIWDRSERQLYLIRDRFGEKPLYYGWINSTLIFASELRAFRCFFGFTKKINRQALDLYMRYCF